MVISYRSQLDNFYYYYYYSFFIGIFILLSRESDQCAVRARLGVAGHLSTTLRWGIPLGAFPNGTTSELAGLLHAVPLILNVKQGSYEYQFSSHWLHPTRNQAPSLPTQKQTLYSLGHRIGQIIIIIRPPQSKFLQRF